MSLPVVLRRVAQSEFDEAASDMSNSEQDWVFRSRPPFGKYYRR